MIIDDQGIQNLKERKIFGHPFNLLPLTFQIVPD
jgi:hypothetical protein